MFNFISGEPNVAWNSLTTLSCPVIGKVWLRSHVTADIIFFTPVAPEKATGGTGGKIT